MDQRAIEQPTIDQRARVRRLPKDNGDWRLRARCRDEDPELFFPIGTAGPSLAQVDRAMLVCRCCEVTTTCLEWALGHDQVSGVWGGTTEQERTAMLRARSAAARG